jgi:Flp pilus assembly protein TadG
MRRIRDENGQTVVILVLFLFVIVGLVGAVLDVGAWFRADRETQSTADAAALAGAQELPDDPGSAATRALEYANKNGASVAASDVTFETAVLSNDTIAVRADDEAPAVFTKLFGLDTVAVGSNAKARTGVLSSAKYVAPIVVHHQHPMLQCAPPPCAGATQIDLLNLHSPGGGNGAGAFGLINLDPNASNGNAGASTVADWMERGFQDAMSLGWYYQVPSSQFNNVQFRNALSDRLNTEVLFPIYRQLIGGGQNARFEIIGWVGFVPTEFDASGSNGTVYGSFKRVIWQGLPSSNPGQQPFGAYAVQLIE